MERIAEKEEGEREVAPEVAAARAELQAEPLAEEDLATRRRDDDEGDEDDDEDEARTRTDRRARRGRNDTASSDGDESRPQAPALGGARSSGRSALFPGGVNSPVRAFKAVGGDAGLHRARRRARTSSTSTATATSTSSARGGR